MPVLLRVVLDTNALLAGRLSDHPTSPAAEILDRWQRREFVVLYSFDTLAEYAEKLLSRGIAANEVETFIRLLARHAEIVPITFSTFAIIRWTRTT
jgi:predicted nucleic acid-binding protein